MKIICDVHTLMNLIALEKLENAQACKKPEWQNITRHSRHSERIWHCNSLVWFQGSSGLPQEGLTFSSSMSSGMAAHCGTHAIQDLHQMGKWDAP